MKLHDKGVYLVNGKLCDTAPASQEEARQERRITLIYIAVFIAFFGGILGGVYLTYLMETRLMFLCAAILFVVWIWQRWDDRHTAD